MDQLGSKWPFTVLGMKLEAKFDRSALINVGTLRVILKLHNKKRPWMKSYIVLLL